ncbi:hypothetical protein FKM82_015479 [Ascaphus truei]
MLAVRHADLFENLPMVTDYRPLAVLEELLEHDANPRLCDYSGKSAMHYASRDKGSTTQQLIDVLAKSICRPETQDEAFCDFCPNTKPPLSDRHTATAEQTRTVIQSCSHSTEFGRDAMSSVNISEEVICNRESNTGTSRADATILLDFQNASSARHEMGKAYKVCDVQKTSLPRVYGARLWNTDPFSNDVAPQFKMKRHTSLPPCHLNKDENAKQIKSLGLGYYGQGSRSEPNISQSLLGLDPLRDIKDIKHHIKQRLSTPDSTSISNEHVLRPCLSPRTGRLTPLENSKALKTAGSNISCVMQALFPNSDTFPKSSLASGRLYVHRDLQLCKASLEHYNSEGLVLSTDPAYLDKDDGFIYSESMKQNDRTYSNEEINRRALESTSGKDQLPQAFENKDGGNVGSIHCDGTSGLHAHGRTATHGNGEEISPISKSESALRIGMYEHDETAAKVETTSNEVLQNGPENEEATSHIGTMLDHQETYSLNRTVICKNGIAEEILDVFKPSSECEECHGLLVHITDHPTGYISCFNGSAVCDSSRKVTHGTVPLVHITFSEQEPQKEFNIPPVKQYLLKRKTIVCGVPHNVNHSFNIIAQRENEKSKKMKKYRNKSASDVSMKHQQRPVPNSKKINLKGVLFPSVGFSGSPVSSRPSKKAHHAAPNGSGKAVQRSQLSCTKERSLSPTKVIVHSISRAKTAPDFLDLKYSDMFMEIKSQNKGPGIYEMFGTPIYSNAKESTKCDKGLRREVVSAPSNINPSSRLAKSNDCSKKIQKRTNSRNKKSTSVFNQKHKTSATKERSGIAIQSNVEQDNAVIISGTDWQIKTVKQDVFPNGDLDLELSEVLEPNQQNIYHSELSIIKEATMEGSLNINGTSGNSQTKMLQELENSPDDAETVLLVLYDRFSTREPQEDDEVQNFQELETRRSLQTPQDLNSGPKKLEDVIQLFCDERVEEPKLEDQKTMSNSRSYEINNSESLAKYGKTEEGNSDAYTVSQTYENVHSCADSEQQTDELICCLAEKLLSLDEKDSRHYITLGSARIEDELSNDNDQCDVIGQERQMCNLEETNNGASQNYNSISNSLNVTENIISELNLNNAGSTNWTKGEVLGKGAYGTVYCGLTSHGQLIAAKQVVLDASEPAMAQKEYKKLQEEVDLLKILKNVNIVGYLGTCLQDNIVTIFMEFVPGGSISSILKRFGPLSEIVFIKYTKQIVQGIAYLHDNRVIHRDIKGNNIMLMPNGVIKLIDFGCAKRLTCVNMSGTHSEMLKSMHGTPYWMAPEVINESGHGRKSDIWSAGCTVFEMATGKPPLAHMHKMAAMFYIGAQRGLMPTLPDYFSKKARDFVNLCLTRDQHERPSAVQLLQHPFIKRKL